MMLTAKLIAKRFLWNAIMAAIVFLPAFLITAQIQVLLFVGLPRRTTFIAELSNWIYVYFLFVLPLILASFVYSLGSLSIRSRWTSTRRRLAAMILAVLLPATVYLLNLPGGLVYGTFYIPTVSAMVLYGMCARTGKIE